MKAYQLKLQWLPGKTLLDIYDRFFLNGGKKAYFSLNFPSFLFLYDFLYLKYSFIFV